MMGRTHLVLGINTLWLLEVEPLASLVARDPMRFPLCLGAAALGALLPDLDAGQSLLSNLSLGGVRPLLLPARAISRTLGHRGVLHSLTALGVLGVVSLPIVRFEELAWLALLLGYLSHLLGDACTKRGIPLFHVPLLRPRRSPVHLLPQALRLTTGSLAEEAVFVLLASAALTLLLRHLLAFTLP
jgi:inner membrane protein